MLKTPTGLIDYAKMKENDYYVGDKTMLINDFLDDGKKVTHITRPRRFGKTINRLMIAEFFDMTKDSKNHRNAKDIKILLPVLCVIAYVKNTKNIEMFYLKLIL